MTLHLQIDGSAIRDIPSFHAEINRVFMSGEDWQLGPSLDALDDLLYGGYGALAGHATATVLWRDIERSRVALGVEATLAWLEAKLQQPGTFNADLIGRQRAALERGEGQTYFEIIMEIFAGHPRIRLVPG
ncbi:barstar family protein [Stenotrophomonas sp.]|uniref:barstar family protein n=1 Tax=Stenotrophomonas sp. TaxID=69392 RepID=UPI00289D8F96|nr:barstar family protein [Stenotrophomonas sp.]